MSLHGKIEVNGQPIGSWSARRTTIHPDPDGAAVYDCAVTMYADDPPHVETFKVTHVVADGAVALAAKVLTRGQRTRQRVVTTDGEREKRPLGWLFGSRCAS